GVVEPRAAAGRRRGRDGPACPLWRPGPRSPLRQQFRWPGRGVRRFARSSLQEEGGSERAGVDNTQPQTPCRRPLYGPAPSSGEKVAAQKRHFGSAAAFAIAFSLISTPVERCFADASVTRPPRGG